jgi:Ca-activated chloride channel family protein
VNCWAGSLCLLSLVFGGSALVAWTQVRSPANTPPVQTQQQKDEAPSRQGEGVFVFKKDVQEVVLHASVLDDKHHFVPDLGRDNFVVFENGQPQQVTFFHREDIPVALGIVIDNSSSMCDKRPAVNRAALNLVKASNPMDEVFVVNFNEEYYLDQDFTANIDKLQAALERVESRGRTALYDAIVASADHLKSNGRLEKRVLVVVTDGDDNSSRGTLETTIQRVQAENGPIIYTIGILGEERTKRTERSLNMVAESTGGVAYLPHDIGEVDEISRQVAHDIRNQYTIGYKPSTPQNQGGYRLIKVEARAPRHKKLVVRTRTGYFAGQERAAR